MQKKEVHVNYASGVSALTMHPVLSEKFLLVAGGVHGICRCIICYRSRTLSLPICFLMCGRPKHLPDLGRVAPLRRGCAGLCGHLFAGVCCMVPGACVVSFSGLVVRGRGVEGRG
jgi:hypothetical protein